MQRNKLYLFGGLLVTLSLVAACGRSARAVPTVDSSARETSLAATALAFGTATPSPAPTKTSIPTAVVSPQGTSLVTQEDGSVLFVDHKAGMQVTFPADWLAVRVGEPEYYEAWEKETTKSPVFMNVFISMQSTDPDQFRVTVIDTRSEPVTYENFSKMEVVYSPDDRRTLNEVRVAQTQKPLPLTKYKLLSSSLTKTSNGLDAAIIEFQWESTSPEKVTSTSYHKEVIIKVPTGAVSIQLFTGLDQKDILVPVFDQVIGSLVFITP
jgi:hypothetical protein